VTLRKGVKLGIIFSLNSVAAIVPFEANTDTYEASTQTVNVPRTVLDDFHKEYGFRLCPDLDEHKRYQVLEMLYRYKSVFARDMTEIEQCKGEPLKLELHMNRKMIKLQYRLS